jgi:hypothetical protein
MDQSRSSGEPDPIALMWACVIKVLEADGNPSPPEIVRHAAAAGLTLSESTFTGWFEVWPVTPRRVVPQWRTFETFIKALAAEQDRDWKMVWDAAQRAKNEAARREREASPPPPVEPDRARVGGTPPAALEGSGSRESGAAPSRIPGAAAEDDTDGGDDGVPDPRRDPRPPRRGAVVGAGVAVVLLALVGGVWKLGSDDPPPARAQAETPPGGAATDTPADPDVTVPSTRCDRYAVAPVDLWLRDEYGAVADGELVHDEQVTVLQRRGPTGGKYWRVTTDDGIAGWVDHSYLRPLCASRVS